MDVVQDRGAGRSVPSVFHTFVIGWPVLGVLDAIAASANAATQGVSPVRVWQYVASSLVGPESYERGATTVMIGLLIHFGVALGVATGFYLLARLFPIVIRHAVASGIIYGIVVFFLMSYVIVPMTQVRQGAFSWRGFISGILIHMFIVGLTPALITKRFAKPAA